MNATKKELQYVAVLALILLAMAGRLLPHPPNFTPVLAIALFAGAVLPKRAAYAVPLFAMVTSDLLLGFVPDVVSFAVYGSFIAVVAAGSWLKARRTWGRTIAIAFVGSLVFYATTNFAVWLSGAHGLYEPTANGLAQCYWMALPFFRNALAGDLFWTALLFGLYDLVWAAAGWRHSQPNGLSS